MTIYDIRKEFFNTYRIKPIMINKGNGTYRRATHNEYNATIRTMFSMFVDTLHRDGRITDNQAQDATL